ncbi:MAG: DnaJ domain [Akkermansiaceae bacterium]|nr:DnaJ domain [Akkermansiaceae bacterium]
MGLTPEAPPEVIKATFRELAKRRHPDTGGSHEAFTELVTACEEALS